MAENEKEKSELVDRPSSQPEADGVSGARPPLAQPGAGVEPDEPASKAIVAVLGGLALIVGMASLGLWQLFGLTSIAELEVKDLQVDNMELLELRARDWGRLTQYEALDGGTYQIPIERAMEKLVREPGLIAPLVVQDAGPQDAQDAESDAGMQDVEVSSEAQP